MCGIVGTVVKLRNGFTKTTEDCFYQMLFVDALRGEDSTGMIFVETDSSFGIMKDAYSSQYVIDDFKDSVLGKKAWTKGKALIGHNRKATVGAVSKDTAHPFVVDEKFAMVHNGTLRNHKALADTVVDSEALAIHLSKVLVEDFNKEDFEAAMGKVEGAYAIAAYSQDTDKIYLTRNAERPLAYLDTSEGLFFASELMMLYWICSRNNVTMKDNDPKWLKPNELLTFDLRTNALTLLDYVPKKAMPVIRHTVRVAGKDTTIGQGGPVATSDKSVSKSQFKHMRHRWLNRALEFYADDFIEKDYPNTIAKGSHEVNLMGESDSFVCSHTVYGEYDLHDMAPGNVQFLDRLYTGIVSNMTYNKVTGSITFTLTGIKQVPQPILSLTYENQSTLH
jgi:predicted glutamine amidotransferase